MPPSPTSNNSIATDIAVIKSQLIEINSALGKLNTRLDKSDESRENFRVEQAQYASECKTTAEMAQENDRRLDKIEEFVVEQRQQNVAQRQQNKIIAWIGGIVGSLIIVSLVSALLGQIIIQFP